MFTDNWYLVNYGDASIPSEKAGRSLSDGMYIVRANGIAIIIQPEQVKIDKLREFIKQSFKEQRPLSIFYPSNPIDCEQMVVAIIKEITECAVTRPQKPDPNIFSIITPPLERLVEVDLQTLILKLRLRTVKNCPEKELDDMQPEVAAPSNAWKNAWRIIQFRSLLILCTLFPNQKTLMEQFFTSYGLPLQTVAGELDLLGECLAHEDNGEIRFEIKSELLNEVKQWVRSDLCNNGESIETLHERIKAIFSNASYDKFFAGLIHPQHGFFAEGCLCGGQLERSRFVANVYVAVYNDWQIVIGVPTSTQRGRLIDQSVVRDLHYAAARQSADNSAKYTYKVLCAPAFSTAIVFDCGLPDYGIHLLDWLALTYLQKFQSEHGCLEQSAVDKAYALFYRVSTGKIWDYLELKRFWDSLPK